MGFVFIICVLGMIMISLRDKNSGIRSKGLEIDSSMFKLKTGFAIGGLIICGLLAALYTVYW